MTAFTLQTLLLLFIAFAAGIGFGLLLRGPERREKDRALALPDAASLDVAPASPVAAPAGEARGPVPAVVRPSAEAALDDGTGAAARDGAPEAVDAAPAAAPAKAEDDTAVPPRAPVSDLFSHLLSPDTVVREPRAVRADPARGAHPGTRPPTLDAAQDGKADDLKLLKGIGPQNEQRLNALGVFHFHQIAAWTADEAAWVGSYLAFPGRIERENWIGQARALLAGTPPEALQGAPRKPRPPRR